MELKTVLRFSGLILSPACACLMITAGCTTESEIPMPPGAYVAPPEKPVPPENSALSTEPASDFYREPAACFPKDSDEQVFTLEEMSEGPTAKPAQKAAPAEKTGPVFAKDDIIYTIRKNDTLGGIARRYGMTAPALADYNGISLKSKIYPGKTLHIPAGVKSSAAKTPAVPAGASLYVVRAGDTLGGIAQKHSVRTADLAAANNLDIRKPIRVGQKLIIPSGAKKTTAPAAKKEPAKAAAPAAAKKTAPAAAAKKTTAPAAKTTPATVAKQEPAKPAPAAEQKSADDLLKSIGSDSAAQTEPAPAESAAASSVSVAAPAKEEGTFGEDTVIEITIEREMTLEETAKAFDRSYATVKKLNPSISPDARLKAGTAVKIPIF